MNLSLYAFWPMPVKISVKISDQPHGHEPGGGTFIMVLDLHHAFLQ